MLSLGTKMQELSNFSKRWCYDLHGYCLNLPRENWDNRQSLNQARMLAAVVITDNLPQVSLKALQTLMWVLRQEAA
jgi:hypothetical protein